MKKILFSLFLATVLTCAYAQNSAIDNAVLYHKDGTLDQAKKEIDKAVEHEKTKANAKAWCYKGIIYADLYKSLNADYKALTADPLMDAVNALLKAKELDAAKGQWYQLSDSKLKELWAEVVNKGIGEYESEKLKEAQTSFELAQRILPEDTAAYIYGAYAAESLGDNTSLKMYMDKLTGLNYKSVYYYRTLIALQTDSNKKIEIAKKASADYPAEAALVETLGDCYYEAGQNKEALNSYAILLGWMPQSTSVMTKMALQHQKLNENDKALEYYEKVIKAEPINFLARYNAAIIYFEKGKVLYTDVHKLSVDEYQKRGKQMEEEMALDLNKALEHAKAAINLTNDEADKNSLNTMVSDIEKMKK